MPFEYKKKVYLVEKQGKVMDVVKEIISDRCDYMQEWINWMRKYLPENANMLVGDDGFIHGFRFDNMPDDWKKPNQHGASMPRSKNPLNDTMPKNKRYPEIQPYFEKAGIHIPTRMDFYNSQNERIHSECIGHWLKPVHVVYTAENEARERLMALVLPDYEYEIGKARLSLNDGECIKPDENFDYKNFLEGCRIIPEYEWDHLVKQWQIDNQQQKPQNKPVSA